MKDSNPKDLLIIGIGNSGRQDDGIAWKILEKLEEQGYDNVEYRYQLQIEDAELISNYHEIVFIDASKKTYKSGYSLDWLESQRAVSYSTHSIPPEHILFLCEDIFGVKPTSKILAVTGYAWELEIGLSDQALINLDAGLNAIINYLKSRGKS
jgi:hydrogenase maturation protease